MTAPVVSEAVKAKAPSLPEPYVCRALRISDREQWRKLIEDLDELETTSVNYFPNEFFDDVVDGRLDPAQDTLGIFVEQRLIGYSLVRAKINYSGLLQLDIEGCVHQEHRRRGLGTALVRWSLQRARERWAWVAHRRPATVRIWTQESNADLVAILRRTDLQPIARWYEISCEVKKLPPMKKPPLPEGFRLAKLSERRLAELAEVHRETFADQEEDRIPPARWEQDIMSDPTLLLELSSVILAPPGEVASYLLAREVTEDSEEAGIRELIISYVGTPRKWRGRHLYKYLVAEAEDRAREEGYDTIGFAVNATNQTGAMQVFERTGMFDWERDYWECWDCYSLEFSAT